MTRFFIDKSNISGTVVTMNENPHIRALRLRVGDELILCDGERTDYLCRLTSIGTDDASAEIISSEPSRTEPTIRLAVYLAFAKGERLDLAVQKCVELGASEFHLFPSERVVARPEGKSLEKRLTRLSAISRSAAEQSRRGIVPSIYAFNSFQEAVKSAQMSDLPLFLYENELETTLEQHFSKGQSPQTVSVMTGCEGGFTPGEASFAIENGMQSVTLGPRILRCETAPIAAAAAIMLLTGNL